VATSLFLDHTKYDVFGVFLKFDIVTIILLSSVNIALVSCYNLDLYLFLSRCQI